MIRTAARWYLVTLGVALAVGSWRMLPRLLPEQSFSAMHEGVAITAGVLLVLGGVAGLMRLPGRVPAAYLGIGAGLSTLAQIAGAIAVGGVLMSYAAVVYVALALLVIASWSLWPSNG